MWQWLCRRSFNRGRCVGKAHPRPGARDRAVPSECDAAADGAFVQVDGAAGGLRMALVCNRQVGPSQTITAAMVSPSRALATHRVRIGDRRAVEEYRSFGYVDRAAELLQRHSRRFGRAREAAWISNRNMQRYKPEIKPSQQQRNTTSAKPPPQRKQTQSLPRNDTKSFSDEIDYSRKSAVGGA